MVGELRPIFLVEVVGSVADEGLGNLAGPLNGVLEHGPNVALPLVLADLLRTPESRLVVPHIKETLHVALR